jgi:cobalt-zinc-cadmium efflux system outer membrane protein
MRLEAKQARTGIHRMESEIAGMTELLKPMLGLRPNESLGLSGSLPSPQTPKAQRPSDSRPDIVAARQRLTAAEQAILLAKAKKWDDVSGGIMVERERRMDMPEGLMDETMVGFRFSIPLPFWNKNQGEIAESTAMHGRAQAELEAVRIKANAEAEAARRQMRGLFFAWSESSGELQPLAKEQWTLMREAYSNNKAGLLDVLRARDRLLMVEMSTVEALREFHLARIKWKAALGEPNTQAK